VRTGHVSKAGGIGAWRLEKGLAVNRMINRHCSCRFIDKFPFHDHPFLQDRLQGSSSS